MIVKIHELTKTNLLGSRQTAETIREIILQHIQKGEKITLDFENISLITQGFADELIGILVRAFGIEFVKSNIKIVNATENIRKMLNTVAHYSKNLIPNP